MVITDFKKAIITLSLNGIVSFYAQGADVVIPKEFLPSNCATTWSPEPDIDLIKPSAYKWTSTSLPSEALWQFAFITRKQKLPAVGSKLSILDYPKFLQYCLNHRMVQGKAVIRAYDFWQSVEPNAASEYELITASTLATNPHEVLKFTVISENGQSVNSEIIHGTDTLAVDYLGAVNFMFQAAETETNSKPKELLIDHTHPDLELSISISRHKYGVTLHPLSTGDITIASSLSAVLPGITIRIRAITPNLNYGASFLGGKIWQPNFAKP